MREVMGKFVDITLAKRERVFRSTAIEEQFCVLVDNLELELCTTMEVEERKE